LWKSKIQLGDNSLVAAIPSVAQMWYGQAWKTTHKKEPKERQLVNEKDKKILRCEKHKEVERKNKERKRAVERVWKGKKVFGFFALFW
jgi:hypothetical protein